MLETRRLGTWDRIARVAIGMVLLVLIARADDVDLWTLGGGVAGTALIVTGFSGLCMLYPLLGLKGSRR